VSFLQEALAGTKLNPKKEEPPQGILDNDFLTGFESGIFLRKEQKKMDEYNCSKAAIQIKEFKKVRDLLPSIKGIVVVMGNTD